MVKQFNFLQFNLTCHFFAHSLNVNQFYLTYRQNLSSITTPEQSGPGSNVNEGVLHIP